MLGEFGSVSVREEVGVDLLELLQRESATGAVPQEAFVPLSDLMLSEVCVLHQVLHDIRTELAVLFAHGPASDEVVSDVRAIKTAHIEGEK